MNIKNRLGKLEKTGNKSGFCECRQTRKVETYREDFTSDAETNEPELMGEPVPDICPDCGKAIEKQVIILQFVESEFPKPEGAR